ncbi:transcriptional regulator [Gordonia sp. X0973]|uniref:sigma-54-dependent Fis family transcriptional regulator n=1 Tax=Gordonia sp. X0973 TaxID=2742602 RepID=UPI000F532926|nr:helix-turn-helix domain-containing protein [Gordonia sp. X0973]QKT08816.1 transcriptional regulator [Gordonia sp. X0973]
MTVQQHISLLVESPKEFGSAESFRHPEIVASWNRSRVYGLERAAAPRLVESPLGRRTSLEKAAGPLLDRLRTEFDGAPMTVTLADTQGRILDVRATDDLVEGAVASMGIRRGISLAEDLVGTNSIGTILETRTPLMLRGTDHFMEAFSGFTCFGHPVFHPVTRRLEGVLNVGGSSAGDDRFFQPIARRLIADIENQLAVDSPFAQQTLLTAFHANSHRHRGPVMVIGEGLVLANPEALDLLDPVAQAAVRSIAAGVAEAGEHSVLLESGSRLRFTCTPVAGTSGVLVHFAALETASGGAADADGEPNWPVLICGEAGTGRTTEAVRLAGSGYAVLDAADVVSRGDRDWVRGAERELGRDGGVLIIENVDLLDPSLAMLLAKRIHRSRRRIVLTATDAPENLSPCLLGASQTRQTLIPLRRRRQDVPAIATRMLAEESGGAQVRLTTAALRALADCSWSGNLQELRRVVRTLARTRSAGDITPADFPDAYRHREAALPPLQRAERDVIIGAIRAADGNKMAAARALGVSRSTLYNRLRALKIAI